MKRNMVLRLLPLLVTTFHSKLKTKILFFLLFSLSFCFTVRAQGNRIWSTYYGGPSNEVSPSGGPCVTTDLAGNVYLAGYSYSSSGIAFGGYQNSLNGINDGFLVKFDASGNRIWATYYGGNSAEYINGITTDVSGNIYITGKTASTVNISSSGAFQNAFGGGTFDAFLAKFNSSGNLIWSTYYGGTADDVGGGVAVDVSGNVYMVGSTGSPSGISASGFQNVFGGVSDAFLVKFNALGNRLWSTYYGGTSGDSGDGVALDISGNVFITGTTSSTVGIAASGFQNTFAGNGDAFLTKFDSNGSRLWATYYGGPNGENVSGVISRGGSVYITGYTRSTSNMAYGGFQNIYGGGVTEGDGFVVRFSLSGNRMWASYFGGPGEDYCESISSDNNGMIYISGDTYSSSGIFAFGGFQNTLQGSENGFMAKIDSTGQLQCATYFGISHEEDGHIAADASGNVYLAGGTLTSSGLASGGFQNTSGGNVDAYLAKFSTTCLDVGITESKNLYSSSNHLFPNPNNGKFHIEIENEIKNGEIILFNSTGQEIYKEKVTSNTYSISMPQPGLYYYLIRSADKSFPGKLIIE